MRSQTVAIVTPIGNMKSYHFLLLFFTKWSHCKLQEFTSASFNSDLQMLERNLNQLVDSNFRNSGGCQAVERMAQK
jgi:hypothetical protein